MSSSAASVSDQESGYFTDAHSHITDFDSEDDSSVLPVVGTTTEPGKSNNEDDSSLTPQATITEHDKIPPMKADSADQTTNTVEQTPKDVNTTTKVVTPQYGDTTTTTTVPATVTDNSTISPPTSVSNVPVEPVTPSRRTLDPLVLAKSPATNSISPVDDSGLKTPAIIPTIGTSEATTPTEETTNTTSSTASAIPKGEIINKQPAGVTEPEYKKVSESSTSTEGTSAEANKVQDDSKTNDSKAAVTETSPDGHKKALVAKTDGTNNSKSSQKGGYKREESQCHEYYCALPCVCTDSCAGVTCQGGILTFISTILTATVTVATKALSKIC